MATNARPHVDDDDRVVDEMHPIVRQWIDSPEAVAERTTWAAEQKRRWDAAAAARASRPAPEPRRCWECGVVIADDEDECHECGVRQSDNWLLDS